MSYTCLSRQCLLHVYLNHVFNFNMYIFLLISVLVCPYITLIDIFLYICPLSVIIHHVSLLNKKKCFALLIFYFLNKFDINRWTAILSNLLLFSLHIVWWFSSFCYKYEWYHIHYDFSKFISKEDKNHLVYYFSRISSTSNLHFWLQPRNLLK